MDDDKKLNRKEVGKLVDVEFGTYMGEVFEALKKVGYPQFTGVAFASDIVKALQKACVDNVSYSNSTDVVKISTKVKQTYIQKFNELISKEQKTNKMNSKDIEYYAGKSYMHTLEKCLGVDFGGSVHTLPGCYGRSAKKEKF